MKISGPSSYWKIDANGNVYRTDGYVGVGTSIPAYKLDVSGDAYVSGGIINSVLSDVLDGYQTQINLFDPSSPGSLQHASDGYQQQINNIGTVCDGYISTDDSRLYRVPEIVSVSKTGDGYISVADAMDHITDASSSKPYTINIAPGIYYEPPFVCKPGVSLQGQGAENNATLVASDPNAHFITIQAGTIINKVAISGPLGNGYAAIYREDITTSTSQPAVIINTFLTHGYYGIWLNSNDAIEQASTVLTHVIVVDDGSGFNQFLRVTNNNVCTAVDCEVSMPIGPLGCGIYAFGAHAQVIFSGLILSSKYNYPALDAYGVIIDAGASARITNCTFDYVNTAVYIGALGASIGDIANTTITTQAIKSITVISPSATLTFSGMTQNKNISIAPGAAFTASFLDPVGINNSPGLDVIGELYLGTEEFSIPLRSYGLHTYSTGWSSGGYVSRAGGLFVNIALGTGYINTVIGVTQVNWSYQNIPVPSDAASWIVIDTAGIASVSLFDPDLSSVIVLVAVRSSSSDIVFISDHRVDLSQCVPDKFEYAESVMGPMSLSGCLATINSPPLSIDVEAGTFYISDMKLNALSHTPISFTYWYRSGSGWSFIQNNTLIDTFSYDDESGSLVPVPDGYYKKDLLFLSSIDDVTEYHIVYGQQIFTTQGLAEVGNNPLAPDTLLLYGLRIAGVVSLKGDDHISSLVDQRPKLGQLSSVATGITRHGDLSGLNADDHQQYQLRTEENDANGYLGLDSSGKVNPAQLYFESPGNPPVDSDANPSDIGLSSEISRADHKHQVDTATASAIGGANAEGSSPNLARADHNHLIRETVGPTNLSVGGIPDGYYVARSGTSLVGKNAICAVNAGGHAISTGAINFSNANNVTFGINGQTITASASYPTQSIQTQSIVNNFVFDGNISGTTATISSGNLSFFGGDNITFSQSGNAVTIFGRDRQPIVNAISDGFGSMVSSGTLQFANSNDISFGLSGSTITASYSQSIQTQNIINNLVLAGTNTIGTMNTISSGTLYLAGGNNITLSQVGNNVTISGPNIGGAQTGISVIVDGNNSSVTAGTVQFANAHGISFGFSGSTITGSYVPDTFVLVGTNTSGTLSTISNGTISLAGGNNITLSQVGNAITISGPNIGGAQTGISVIADGNNSSVTAGTVQFANAHGISFGFSGSTMTASYSQTIQSYNLIAAGTQTANTTGSVVWSNSNNVTFGMSNNSVITASASQSVQPYNIAAAGTQTANTTGSVVWSNSNNVTFGMSNNSVITASASFNQTQPPSVISLNGTSGSLSLYGASNITVSNNGSAITMYGPANILNSFSIGGNTGTTGSSAITGGGFILAGGNNITLSQSNNTISVIGNALGQGIAFGADGTTFSAGTVVLSNANNVSFGMSGSIITASFDDVHNVYLAAGTQTATGGTVIFSNANNISFGMDSGSVITVAAPLATISHYPTWPLEMATSTINRGTTVTTAGGTQTSAIFNIAPMVVENYLHFNELDIIASCSTGGGNNTGSVTMGFMFGIYTITGGTLNSVSTFMFGVAGSKSGNSITNNVWIGTDSTTNSSGIVGNSITNLTGLRMLPLYSSANTISPGHYIMAFGHTVSTANAGYISMSNIGFITASQSTFASYLGSTAINPPYILLGVFGTTVSSNAANINIMPATINTTVISNTGGSTQWGMPWYVFQSH